MGETTTKYHAAASSQNAQTATYAAAETLRKREEMEAREARINKNDFINYCTDVLTQHKQPTQGNGLPNKKDKYRVL